MSIFFPLFPLLCGFSQNLGESRILPLNGAAIPLGNCPYRSDSGGKKKDEASYDTGLYPNSG